MRFTTNYGIGDRIFYSIPGPKGIGLIIAVCVRYGNYTEYEVNWESGEVSWHNEIELSREPVII